mmetsp:Transcript_44286/g.111300  ORF Transcript_44286/g.111300 Transcript_44286/m.111300 type:complete len:210 (-) Transcript_44286:512-1141(-)
MEMKRPGLALHWLHRSSRGSVSSSAGLRANSAAWTSRSGHSGTSSKTSSRSTGSSWIAGSRRIQPRHTWLQRKLQPWKAWIWLQVWPLRSHARPASSSELGCQSWRSQRTDRFSCIPCSTSCVFTATLRQQEVLKQQQPPSPISTRIVRLHRRRQKSLLLPLPSLLQPQLRLVAAGMGPRLRRAMTGGLLVLRQEEAAGAVVEPRCWRA